MDSYVLFINTGTDSILIPTKGFLGGRITSTTQVDLMFEKAPMSYKISLTVENSTGPDVLLEVGKLFHGYTGSIIRFDNIRGVQPTPNVSSISSISKIITK